MTTELEAGRGHRATDTVYRTSAGQKIKRARERGLLPFLDDPQALVAELQRRISQHVRERYPDLKPADNPEYEATPGAGPTQPD